VIPVPVLWILANNFAPEKYSASIVLSPGKSELIVAFTDTLGVFREREDRAVEIGVFWPDIFVWERKNRGVSLKL
jgi:hypothetical protein